MRITIERLLAFMADWVVLFTVLALPQFLIAMWMDSWILAYDSPPVLMWGWVTLTVSRPSWLYFTLSDSSMSGATLGKRLLQLSVRGVDDDRIARGRALLRGAIKLLPWELTHIMIFFPEPFGDELSATKMMLIVLVDLFLIVWLVTPLVDRSCHRAIHDRVARTRVVKTR